MSRVTRLPLSPAHSLLMPAQVYVPRPYWLTPQSALLKVSTYVSK